MPMTYILTQLYSFSFTIFLEVSKTKDSNSCVCLQHNMNENSMLSSQEEEAKLRYPS